MAGGRGDVSVLGRSGWVSGRGGPGAVVLRIEPLRKEGNGSLGGGVWNGEKFLGFYVDG